MYPKSGLDQCLEFWDFHSQKFKSFLSKMHVQTPLQIPKITTLKTQFASFNFKIYGQTEAEVLFQDFNVFLFETLGLCLLIR